MNINLVQRCTIRRPFVTGRVSAALELDYMGSSEFEYGATRRSLIGFFTLEEKLRRVNCDKIKDKQERILRLYGAFDGFTPEEYAAELVEIMAGRKRCLERTDLGIVCGVKGESAFIRETRADFWWDLENHVMFSFDKIFMNRLPDVLAASWSDMKLREICP